jgi:MFS family permease
MQIFYGWVIVGAEMVVTCVGFASTLGMALGPLAGGWVYDAFGSYVWLFIGSCGVGLGAVAIAGTFRPPRSRLAALPALSIAR